MQQLSLLTGPSNQVLAITKLMISLPDTCQLSDFGVQKIIAPAYRLGANCQSSSERTSTER